jgi:hypothetical protein
MTRFKRQGDHSLDGHALQLAAQIAEKNGQSLEEFLTNGADLSTLLSRFPGAASPIRLHGNRVEEMFGHVAAALGEATAIKREDAGPVITAAEISVRIPDYRIVLKDGREILVEVKNLRDNRLFARMRFKLRYLQALASYSALFNRPIYIAIYWSAFRIWTMHPVSELIECVEERCLYLEFPQALAASHMSVLGDASIGTAYPLVLRLMVDSQLISREKKSSEESSEEHQITIREVKMFAGNVELLEKHDKDIAWFLMQNNQWEEQNYPNMDGDVIRSVDFSYAPTDPEDLRAQDFAIVTSLSTLASSQFNSLTLTEGKTTRMRVPFVDEIPYFRDIARAPEHSLRIWKLILEPQRLTDVLNSQALRSRAKTEAVSNSDSETTST